jgi:hypothetical protein
MSGDCKALAWWYFGESFRLVNMNPEMDLNQTTANSRVQKHFVKFPAMINLGMRSTLVVIVSTFKFDGASPAWNFKEIRQVQGNSSPP